MPFPVLTHQNFEFTGDTLPLSQLFHPSHNIFFYRRPDSDSGAGKVFVRDTVKIAKALVAHTPLDELLPPIMVPASIAVTTENLRLMRFIYDALPEDKKHFIFWMTAGHTRCRNSIMECRGSLIYPYNFTAGECHREVYTFEFKININNTSMETSITEEQKTILKAELAGPTFEACANLFTTYADSFVWHGERFIPKLINTIWGYAKNKSVFYPNFEYSDFPGIIADWSATSVIADLLNAGRRISLSYVPENGRIKFRPIPTLAERSHLERVLPYSTNVLEFIPYSVKGPKEHKVPLYGVELEANSDYAPRDIIAAQKDLFFILKQDSSIYGSRSQNYEMVTVPCSLKAHKRLWAEFFEKVDYTKFDTTVETGNGMHVHIDRKSFTDKHLNRFTWFIVNPAHEEFIFAISERPSRQNLQEWAPVPRLLDYPTPISASTMAFSRNVGVRGAVHYKGNKTVEVRLFKGIVSYATIVKNLEFVDSVFHYTQQTPLCQMGLDNYLAWVNATPKNKYQLLKAFLSETKLKDHRLAAQLINYLWKEEQDHVIEAKLNKAPFKVTNEHITYLNKKRRKRAFILKDGKVVCVQRNGGILAKFDKSVQQKQMRSSASFTLNDFAA